jgi:FkbM family methyltransferase
MGAVRHATGRLLRAPAVSRVVSAPLRRFARIVPPSVKTSLPTHRVKVPLPGTDRILWFESAGDSVAHDLYWTGFGSYEPETISIFKELLEIPPRVFLDVGAFTGLFALTAAALCPETQVHAFEPSPATFRRLEANGRLNRLPNVHLHHLAVAEMSGDITMYTVPDRDFGITNSLVEGLNGATEPVVVRATSLDDFDEVHHLGRVDLMKIDVESCEHLVFRGGTRILDRDRPIAICEILFGWFDPSLQDILASRDYRFFLITEQGLKAQRGIEGDPAWRDLNYLFVPAEKVPTLPPRLREQAGSGSGW